MKRKYFKKCDGKQSKHWSLVFKRNLHTGKDLEESFNSKIIKSQNKLPEAMG